MKGILAQHNCYFEILDEELDSVIDLINSVVEKYFDDRLYMTWNSQMLMSEKFISFKEYKDKCRAVNITKLKNNHKTRDEIIKESKNILSSLSFEKEVM
ncbi:hypothetical protein GCM10008904_28960 [Paraclostridium ghonii]|uniref:Uncharacterized protein n=1 Tax=Paraclostridium ghonii TaxID=29358 RepID=A0ABU0N380_9FIRM|nr:hypothetical protein [Paeniclostridium ghonii]MDQ0557617.1 hypothetical protein [Paeniclostridium ghonii]